MEATAKWRAFFPISRVRLYLHIHTSSSVERRVVRNVDFNRDPLLPFSNSDFQELISYQISTREARATKKRKGKIFAWTRHNIFTRVGKKTFIDSFQKWKKEFLWWQEKKNIVINKILAASHPELSLASLVTAQIVTFFDGSTPSPRSQNALHLPTKALWERCGDIVACLALIERLLFLLLLLLLFLLLLSGSREIPPAT